MLTQPNAATDHLPTINIIGNGVGALLSISECIISGEEREREIRINWLVAPDLGDGASPSGGWNQLFHMNDPRAEDWAKISPALWKNLVKRFPALAAYVMKVPTIMTSMDDTVEVPPAVIGEVIELDPEAIGIPHFKSAILIDDGIVIDTIGILPVWRALLMGHRQVAYVEVNPVASLGDVAGFASLFGADATITAVGLGARAWGDHELEGVLGWLIIAPPAAPIMGRRHTLMYDAEDVCSYCIPRRYYSVWGGTLSYSMDIFGDSGVDLSDLMQPRPGSARERELDEWVRADAERGRIQAMELWPNAFDALADTSALRIWYSLRPFRPMVANKQLELSVTLGQRVWNLNGLAGAGWTIGPGVVKEMVAEIFETILEESTTTYTAQVRDVSEVELSDVDRPSTPTDESEDGTA